MRIQIRFERSDICLMMCKRCSDSEYILLRRVNLIVYRRSIYRGLKEDFTKSSAGVTYM